MSVGSDDDDIDHEDNSDDDKDGRNRLPSSFRLTFLAHLSMRESVGRSASIFWQWDVPEMKIASSDSPWLDNTLSACHGSIEPTARHIFNYNTEIQWELKRQTFQTDVP